MIALKKIEEFIASEPVGMVGVSRNPKKFGQMAFKELRDKGMNVIPVNPVASEILGVKAYRDVKSLPSEVKSLIIITPKKNTQEIVRDAKEKGFKQIWIQQNADSPGALKELEGSDINYVTGECILMHFKPHGIHKFHKSIKRFFGRFPK
jgi:predicted CoA-binding protein